MKKTIISMALLVLIVAPAAVAQSDKGTSVGTTINGAVPQAPVGHRQPRASDVPNETSDVLNEKNLSSDPFLTKENAMLDKKMKSICRGC
jgi:hypothetical protein